MRQWERDQRSMISTTCNSPVVSSRGCSFLLMNQKNQYLKLKLRLLLKTIIYLSLANKIQLLKLIIISQSTIASHCYVVVQKRQANQQEPCSLSLWVIYDTKLVARQPYPRMRGVYRSPALSGQCHGVAIHALAARFNISMMLYCQTYGSSICTSSREMRWDMYIHFPSYSTLIM